MVLPAVGRVGKPAGFRRLADGEFHSGVTLARTLDSVNLSEAAAVAILTSDDLTNIETGLAIRDHLGERWVDVPVVLRVFDRQLGHRLESSFGFRHENANPLYSL